MENDSIKKIYKNYAFFYDFIFKGFFLPRQRAAILDLDILEGQKVLDVGVGTGLSLPIYPDHCEIVGIDLSTDMLKQARKKKVKLGMDHVKLIEMDAENLDFDDNTFDFVIATHVISVTPKPIKVIEEMRRVAKPDGKIVIVNHFVSSHPLLGKMEKRCDPFFRKLGWRMDMTLEDLATAANLDIKKSYKVNRLDLWKIVHAHNNKSETSASN